MKKIFAANWKLFKTPKETQQFFNEWNKLNFPKDRTFIFFPPALCLSTAIESAKGTVLEFGCQNCASDLQGALTGENSVLAVKDLGAKYVLVGHSERRTLFSESDDFVAKKIKLVQEQSLIPMLCVGETWTERQAGRTNEVLRKQLLIGLSLADKIKEVILAYEPVWAIGTGQVAQAHQVEEAHKSIKSILAEMGFPSETPILYGGSVKPENSKELITVPAVDGFLVGGASLTIESFSKICAV